MAANFSVYMSKKILDNAFVTQAAVTTHSTLYCALFHDSTGTTETNLRANTAINEIADTAYARQTLTMTAAGTFDAATADTAGMEVISNVTIAFPSAAAAYPNNVTHVALMDAATNGNVIMYASITSTAIAIDEYIEILSTVFKINL